MPLTVRYHQNCQAAFGRCEYQWVKICYTGTAYLYRIDIPAALMPLHIVSKLFTSELL